jgi:hypothetical protein
VNALLQLRSLGFAHYLVITPDAAACAVRHLRSFALGLRSFCAVFRVALTRGPTAVPRQRLGAPPYDDVASGACFWSSLFAEHPSLELYRLRGGRGPFRAWWARIAAMARLVVRGSSGDTRTCCCERIRDALVRKHAHTSITRACVCVSRRRSWDMECCIWTRTCT